jgi:hypothetical protein
MRKKYLIKDLAKGVNSIVKEDLILVYDSVTSGAQDASLAQEISDRQAGDNTETTNRTNADALKVDKTTTVNGKALSSNVSLTTTDIPEGNFLYFTLAKVLATALSSALSFATNRVIAAGDSVLVALGLLQKQASDNATAIAINSVPQLIITTSTSITTNTVGSLTGYAQNGKNVIIDNGVNAINLICDIASPSFFGASYSRLGSAQVTIIAGSGVTVVDVYNEGLISNGTVMSSFTIERNGNTFYVKMNNA